MMGNVGIKGHEMIGGAYLRSKGFSTKVAELVESHVLVKRYLTYKDPEYYARLSDSSKTSLKYQGGPLPKDEAEQFERDPLFKLKVKLRQWDEEAKVVDMKVPGLETYRDMMLEHLSIQRKQRSA
jgi:predicted HD phosphohydrolase